MYDPDQRVDPWNDGPTPPPEPPTTLPPALQTRPHDDPPADQYAPGDSEHHRAATNYQSTHHTSLHYARLYLAWTCIGVCTVVLFVFQMMGMQMMQQQYEQDPRPGYNTLYMGRYFVGIDNLFPGQAKQYQPEFDAVLFNKPTPHEVENHIRSIVVASEIAPDSVPDRLARLETLVSFSEGSARQDGQVIQSIYADGYTPTPAERDGLVQRHGWFGEVAATYNLPENGAAYKAPRRSATIVVIGVVGVILVLGGGLLIGLVLAVIGIVLTCLGRIHFRVPTGQASHRTAYLEATALFLLFFIILQVVFGIAQELTGINMLLPILILVATPLIWPVIVGVPWQRFKQDMGYHTGGGLFREVGAGVVGYVAGLPIIAIGMGVTLLLSRLVEQQADHPMQYEMMDGGMFTIFLTLGAAVIWAPLVEESVFRAGFYRHLRQMRGVSGFFIATLITSFVFAAIHPQGWLGIPVLMSIAFVMAGLREWRGSIVPSMVAHAMHNGAVSLFMGIVLFA